MLQYVVVTVLIVFGILCDDKKLSRLQIGIKKRVNRCEMKTRKGDALSVHYAGMLENGKEFDSSRPHNRSFTFVLGMGQVIKGWDQGLLNMCKGETRRLTIPPDLAYGKSGSPPKIPPDATLKFDIELLKIDRNAEL